MKDIKRSFSFAGAMTAAQAAEYLEGMAAAIKAGTLTLESNHSVLGLQPTGVVGIEVEAKRKGNEEKVAVEMRWQRAVVLATPTLKISDQAPPEPEICESDDAEECSSHDESGNAPAAEAQEGSDEDDEEEAAPEPVKKKKKKRRKKKN